MDLSLIGANIVKLWTNYWHIYLIEGVVTTLKLTVFAVVLGALLGVVVAMLKMSKSKIVRFLITFYIEVIRGTPLLLQLMLFYFVLPQLIPIFDFNEFTWVAIALCINSSAYVSEIFRSGIQSVDKGQTEAARSLGLSSWQSMRLVVLPQAIKNVLPALGNEVVTMVKESSMCMVLGMGEIMHSAQTIAGSTYIAIGPFMLAAFIYFLITYPTSKVIERIERRMRRGDKR